MHKRSNSARSNLLEYSHERVLRLFQGAVVVSLVLAATALVLGVAGTRVSGSHYSTDDLRVLPETPDITDTDAAYSALQGGSGATRGYSATKQPEGPFWVLLPLDGSNQSGALAVELRMLRADNPQFWSYRTSSTGKRAISVEEVNSEKGGTTIRVSISPGEKLDLIGRVDPIGVARPKVFVWDETTYLKSERLFERGGGALIGSFLMLAMFGALVGTLNRDWSFFLFSGWLITSLRVAAINDGWDFSWLGLDVNSAAYLVFLRVSLAAHALLTVSLFRSLLARELKLMRLDPAFKALTTAFCVILALGFFLPHRIFLPIVWAGAGIGILLIAGTLIAAVARTRTSVALWYAASWGATFLGVLTEVAYASGLVAASIPGLNSQSASAASALLTAISLAEKLRRERAGRVAAEKRTVSLLKKFEENYNAMPIGLFSVGSDGNLTLFNPAFTKMVGKETRNNEVGSKSFDELLQPGAYHRLLRAATESADIELETETTLGNKRWFLFRVTARIGGGIEGSIQDITTRKAAELQLKSLVDHDHLTGLHNRRGLETQVATAIHSASEGKQCAIAYVDIDRFKIFNDLHGHHVGDSLLQQTAQRLESAVRKEDRVARVADSFVVVFVDCPAYAVTGLTERIRSVIADHAFDIDGKGLTVTASIGVVNLEPHMSVVDAMAAADRACSEAKARGRNCVVRLSDQDETLRRHLEELKVVADLQQRVPTDRYFLEFQPIVALQGAMSSMCYEVLIRMRGEKGETIPPGKFIGAAERNGLMSQIDRWVLRSTLEWLDQHPEHRNRLSFATINISGSSLNDSRFVDDAFAMIAEHPLAMPKLCFEITESVALNDLGSTRRFVDRVRMYGSKLALDDFGAGYTSFNYLKEIPADFIKIDGSFVKDINLNPANYAITRTIVELTHELGMRSIAEWAETPDTIASLIELGVDYGQGFGLVRPVAPAVITSVESGGALVRDPAVVALLEAGPRWASGSRSPESLRADAA